MLQTIRDRAHGWIAWVIVILISVPFALWGVQSYLDIGGEPIVAKVNGVEITRRDLDQRVQRARMRLREQLGAAYDASQFDDGTLRRQALDSMIRETLVVDASNRLGLRVSDQEIRAQILSEQAFQRDGRFDTEAYEQMLRLQGMSPAMFEAQLRQRMVGTQLALAINSSEFVTSAERDALQRLSGQKREVAWLQIPAARFMDDSPVDEDAIKAYYESNADRFQIPEQVKLAYLVLDVAGIAADAEVSEEELLRAYEAEQSRFGRPERRAVRHILVAVPSGADETAASAALTEIQAVRQRIQDGESFAEVARAVSNDPGSASQGGSLGEIERGMMDAVFDDAAFSLEAGALSEPVKTRFGYHLIEVESITPASVKPLDAVRDELRQQVAKQRAEGLFYDMGERLANVVYEVPDSLEPAAEELGLTIEESDWVSRAGGPGVLANPKVMGVAFSDDVLNERRNSDLIEPEKDVLQAVVVRVVDHREASTKPLETVREEIVTALRADRAREGAAEAASAGAQTLKGGGGWDVVAGEDAVPQAQLLARDDPKLPASVREVAFTLPIPAEGQSSVGTADLPDGDAAIISVTKVESGEVTEAPNEQTKRETDMLGRLLGRQAYDSVLEDIEARADVERQAEVIVDSGEG